MKYLVTLGGVGPVPSNPRHLKIKADIQLGDGRCSLSGWRGSALGFFSSFAGEVRGSRFRRLGIELPAIVAVGPDRTVGSTQPGWRPMPFLLPDQHVLQHVLLLL